MSNPVHVEVIAREGESGERLIRRFMKKVKKERILEDFREHTFYEKPSTKRRKAKKARDRVLRKLRMAEEELENPTNYSRKKRTQEERE